MHQLVVGRTEQRIAGIRPESCAVDQRLRMFDTKTDGERFCLEVNTALVQHLVGVACAMTHRKHEVIGAQFQCLTVEDIQDREAPQLPVVDL